MLYNHAISYVINALNINAAKKTLAFNIVFTKKIFTFLYFFKKNGFILNYKLWKSPLTKVKNFIKIYILYYKNVSLVKNFKIITKPSQAFYISYKALTIVAKRTGNSVFIISTSIGLISHQEALQKHLGGTIVGFFSI